MTSPTSQLHLFGAPEPGLPEDLVYRAEVMSRAEEADLVTRVAALPFAPFDFHGFKGNRRIVSFGGRYDFAAGRLRDAEPIPTFLQAVRQRAAAFAGLDPDDLRQTLVTEYAPGAGIGWHRDRPEFDKVVGVSLASPCVMRFRRGRTGAWERRALPLAPRSAYLLDGPARSEWMHSIAPGAELRYSITFRSLRRSARS